MSLIAEPTYEEFVNLIPNSDVAPSATLATVFTNFIMNPAFRAANTNWNAPTLVACTGTRKTVAGIGGPFPNTGYDEQSVNTISNQTTARVEFSASLTNDTETLAVGQKRLLSIYVYSLRQVSVNIRAQYYLRSSNTYISQTNGPVVILEPSTWTRLSVLSTIPAGADTARINVVFGINADLAIADRFRVSCAQRTGSELLLPYFDGATENYTADQDLVTVWQGTANNSRSDAKGYQPANIGTTSNCAVIVSKRFTQRTLRVIRTGSNSPHANLCAPIPVSPGGVAALSMYREKSTDTLNSNITFNSTPGGNAIILIPNNSQPAPGVWKEYLSPYTPGTEFMIILRSATLIGASIWFKDALIMSKAYDGNGFSGNTPELYYHGTRVFPEWVGTPNNSPSKFRYETNHQFDVNPITSKWDQIGERRYEVGVDRGMLYPNVGSGVPWNGLTEITESDSGGEPTPFYIDGVKYLNWPSNEDFSATMKAFTYPLEFEPHDGTADTGRGLSIGHQPRKPFGLSYRTRIGNDVDGVDHGYKIHLIYNAIASPSDRANKTLGGEISPVDFSWALSTTPVQLTGRKASAHLIIDSTRTDPYLLRELEEIIYGTVAANPRLPTGQEILNFFDEWVTLLIIDHGDGTFTASGPDDVVYSIGTDLYKIDWASVIYTSPTTCTISTL